MAGSQAVARRSGSTAPGILAGVISHRQWCAIKTAQIGSLHSVTAILSAVREDLQAMGQQGTQASLVAGWIDRARALALAGEAIVKQTTARYQPVMEAQARAGGPAEVAGDKKYNE